ncbi:unknown protein; 62289-62625 [Arabidopsis thaliana]|nr:unknown protein; 62289-62625 [Arabidopsis thaliana]
MAKKWQQRAALRRKRISFQRSNSTTSSSSAVEKGCFVVYTADQDQSRCHSIRFDFLGVSHQIDQKTNGWRYRKRSYNGNL